MTTTPPGGPHPDPDLLERLRQRSLRDDPSWFEGAKILTSNPLARGIAHVLRIDLGPLDQAVRDADRMFETVATSIGLFAERGWAPSGNMPIPVYEGAVKVLADGGSMDAAEDALVEGWNDQSVLPYLHHRVLGLGLGKDEEIEGWCRERGRLVRRAWEHHQAGSYEAAIPIVFAQVDGITADGTTTPQVPAGRMFFSTRPRRQAEVVDDSTLAGMNDALPVVRNYFSSARNFTAGTGSDNRHGVMHGRELRYDTKANSTKAFVLLAAVVEWAQPRIRAEIDRRVAERDQRYAGSDETDAEGRRLDRRGFVATRDALRKLALSQSAYHRSRGRFGSIEELRSDVAARTLLEEPEAITVARARRDDWWAWRRSKSGWVFAIGSMSDQPLGWRYYDGPEPPEDGPLGAGWRGSDTGNWSGDWA
jgi:hypothetical protein